MQNNWRFLFFINKITDGTNDKPHNIKWENIAHGTENCGLPGFNDIVSHIHRFLQEKPYLYGTSINLSPQSFRDSLWSECFTVNAADAQTQTYSKYASG